MNAVRCCWWCSRWVGRRSRRHRPPTAPGPSCRTSNHCRAIPGDNSSRFRLVALLTRSTCGICPAIPVLSRFWRTRPRDHAEPTGPKPAQDCAASRPGPAKDMAGIPKRENGVCQAATTPRRSPCGGDPKPRSWQNPRTRSAERGGARPGSGRPFRRPTACDRPELPILRRTAVSRAVIRGGRLVTCSG